MKRSNLYYLIFYSLVLCCWSACEKEFVPPTVAAEEVIVVEGYIEAKYEKDNSSIEARPPFVILTRTQPFFSNLSTEEFEDLFVHDAVVTISNGFDSVRLQEICMEDLDPKVRKDASDRYGLDLDSTDVNFCLYVDPFSQLSPKSGQRYALKVETGDRIITAHTTIPQHVPIDTLFFEYQDGDSTNLSSKRKLREMHVGFKDPPGIKNFYRYFTKVNNGEFVPGYTSVYDDRIFDGRQVEDFFLPKGEPRTLDNNPGIFGFGLYKLGNRATVKWANIDGIQYDFWNALEFNTINQGPFSSSTKTPSNIRGGIGVWGGMSVSFYEVVVSD